MAKSADQRSKDLDGGTRWVLTKAWPASIGKVAKELSAPIFKKNGDMMALAAKYDAGQTKFDEARKKKDSSKAIFDPLMVQLNKISADRGALEKEFAAVRVGNAATLGGRSANTTEECIELFEEALKESQDDEKDYKAICDNLLKLSATEIKVTQDAIGKAKKDVAAAAAALNAANTELNNLEAQMRALDAKYQKTAFDMNRTDIADAVRSFLEVFG